MAKRLTLYLLTLIMVLSCVLGFMPAKEVNAGTETYNHIIPFTITDTGGVTRTNVPVIISYDVNGKLVAYGLTNATCTDTYVDATGAGNSPVGSGTAYNYMMQSGNITAVIPSLPAFGSITLNLYTGYSPTQTSFPIVTGNGGYFTVADNATLEPSNNFTLHWSGNVDTSVSGIVFQKSGAIYLNSNGTGNVTLTIPSSVSTLTIRPNAAGDETNITSVSGAATHYGATGDNNDSSYVSTSSGTYLRDLYNIGNHTTQTGIITQIQVYFRIKTYETGEAAYGKPALKISGTTYDGSEQSNDQSGSWSDKAQTYSTNPYTGVSWTWADIDSLQAGVSLKATGGYEAMCPEVWIAVSYADPILSMADDDEVDITITSDTSNLWMTVDGSSTANISAVSIPNTLNNWQIGSLATPYINSFSIAVAGVTKATYAPTSMIIGTNIPNNTTPGSYNGTITWGTNSSLTITGGSIMDSRSATSVGATSTMMQGNLFYIGTYASVYLSFEYGLDTNYRYYTSETAATVAQTHTVTLTGLTPNTTYHYRALSRSGSVYSYGADITFTTAYSTSSQGSTTPLIQKAGVFSGYKTTGDWLFTAEIVLTYPPYYPAGTPSQYFQMQLIGLDGTTILGASPIKQWGDRPASIYLNSSANITNQSAYQIRVTNISSENITFSTSYTLTGGNWYGSDLEELDWWCIGVAKSMEINDGMTLTDPYVVSTTAYGLIITSVAGGYFTTGIPNIDQIRPNLFGLAKQPMELSALTGDINYNAGSTTIANKLGATIVADAQTVADVFNTSGDNFLLYIIAAVIIGCVIYVVSQTQGFGALGAAVLGVPILAASVYFNIISISLMVIIAAFFVIAWVRQWWIKST